MPAHDTKGDMQTACLLQLATVTNTDYERIRLWWLSLSVDELYALHVATSLRLRNLAKKAT